MVTLQEQIISMRELWPDFRITFSAPWAVGWRGPLKPYDHQYIVQVTLYDGLTIGECDLNNYGPVVKILQPDLRAEWRKQAPPHIYTHLDFALCLFDPKQAEWNTDCYLSTTFIPWAAEWLGFYELWQATGRWTGAERHPDLTTDGRAPLPHPIPARRASIDYVGTVEGTIASAPILRAGSLNSIPSTYDWWRPLTSHPFQRPIAHLEKQP